jgi:hypothetical protein
MVVDEFCEGLPVERPELTSREHQLLDALRRLNGWCIQKLEPALSGLAGYPTLQRDMTLARKAISESTGNNE